MAKKVKKFKNEDEEREFWANVDTTEFFDYQDSQKASFPNLKPSTRTISLRLPESMLEDIKAMANKRDVPYQSLIKILLKEKIDDDSAA